MSKRLELTNQKFGRLTVVEFAMSKNGRSYWLCKCDCGNEKIVIGKDIVNHNIQSCGCYRKESTSKRNTKHGKTNTRLYNIWSTMKRRCMTVKSGKAYKNYFLRGITICEDWKVFENFQKWALANGYSDELSIDRIDNNSNYCPENCRWVNNKVQANNKRSNRYLTYKNKTQTVSQWADELGIKYNTIHERLRRGWNVEKTLSCKIRG